MRKVPVDNPFIRNDIDDRPATALQVAIYAHKRIVAASKRGRGVRLSPAEVRALDYCISALTLMHRDGGPGDDWSVYPPDEWNGADDDDAAPPATEGRHG